MRDYKLSHRRAARACAVGARAVRSALESASKGRQVGVPGCPMVLSQKQQKVQGEGGREGGGGERERGREGGEGERGESDSKGRQVGVPGRPMVLSQKQQKVEKRRQSR